MKAPFFRRLYASYAALVLLTAAVIGLLVHERIEAALTADIKALRYLTAPNMVLSDRHNKSPGVQNRG